MGFRAQADQSINKIYIRKKPYRSNRAPTGHLLCLKPRVVLRRLPATRLPTPAKVVTPKNGILPDDSVDSAGKILLLEDRDDFRQILRDYLVSRRFQVTSVPRGVHGPKG